MAAPTQDELRELEHTEHLFKSNLFKMQVCWLYRDCPTPRPSPGRSRGTRVVPAAGYQNLRLPGAGGGLCTPAMPWAELARLG